MMSAIHSDVNVIKTEVSELKAHAIETDKKIDKLNKSVERLDKSMQILDQLTDRIEKQNLAIGIELKKENKFLEKRVTNLEKEVLPEITH